MIEENGLKDQLCPVCGKHSMDQKIANGQALMVCKECKEQIPFEVYLLSMQMFEKQLLISLLKEFIENGVGKCITHNQKTYIVGIDQDGQIFTQRYQLSQGEEVGMYVSLKFNSQGE